MPITPLSTPLKTEYKPLGLEAFAKPLSEMQAKFDLTKNEIDKTRYALNSLGATDRTRSGKLLNDLDEKTKELSANLNKTGNYRAAALKLQELNSWFNDNKELSAIKSQYDNYKKTYDELNKLRVESKGIDFTQEDLDNWDYKARAEFSGTNYNKETGNYNVGSFKPKRPNQNKNIQDRVIEITKMAANNRTAFLGTLDKLGASGEDASRLIKMIQSEKNREQVAAEIRNFVLQDDQFRDWKVEDAQTEFFVKNDQAKKRASSGFSENPFEFSDQLIVPTVTFLENQVAQLEKVIQSDSVPDEQKKIYEDQKSAVEDEIEDLRELYQNRNTNPEAYEKKAESIYVNKELGYFDTLAISAADLVDHLDTDFSMISSSAGVDNATKTKMDKIGKIDYSVMDVATKRTGSHSTFVEQANKDVDTDDIISLINTNEITLENNLATKNIDPNEGFGIIYKKGTYFKYKELPHYFQNLANLSSVKEFSDKYDAKQEEVTDELTSLYSELNVAESEYGLNSPEYREITSKIVDKNNKKSQLIVSKTSQLKDLDFIVSEIFTELTNNKENNLEIFSETDMIKRGVSSPENTFSDSFVDEFARRHDQRPEMIKEQLENVYDLWQNNTENTQDFLNKLQNESSYSHEIALKAFTDGEGTDHKTEFDHSDLKQSKDFYSLILNEVFDRFKIAQSVGSLGYIQIPKVDINDNVKEFSNGTFTNLLEAIENNTATTTRAKAIAFDENDRTFTYKDPGNEGNYSLSLYNENPSIIGKIPFEKGGPPRLILAYQLKGGYQDYNFGSGAYQAYLKAGGSSWTTTYSKEEQQEDDFGKVKKVSKDMASSFRKNNPPILYLQVDNLSSVDPMVEMENNYIEFVTAGLNSSNPKKTIEIIEQQRSNYAPIHLVNDPERAIEYSRMSKSLIENAQKGIEHSEPQSHAFSQDNGNGTFTEYDIVYQTTSDHKILAQITKSIRTPSSDPKVKDKIESIDLPSVTLSAGNNLPIALLKMDMTFGTGQRNDAVMKTVNGVDSPFIIAFENEKIFDTRQNTQQLINNMNNIIR